MVDAVDARGAAQEGRVRGEQADGPGAEDGDGVAGREAGVVEGGPGGAEDVGDGEVGLLDGAVGGGGREGDGDEVGVGGADVDEFGCESFSVVFCALTGLLTLETAG